MQSERNYKELKKIIDMENETNLLSCPMFSPVSQITHDLDKSSLVSGDTPKRGKQRSADDVFLKLNINQGVPVRKYDVETKNRLFKNVFKIKGTPEGVVKSKLKARRMISMASRRLSSPDLSLLLINKENGSAPCSPLAQTLSPQKIVKPKTPKSRCPLEDCDPNSQDSGYGASYQEPEDGFRFAEPLGVAPRRISMESRSPQESPIRSSPSRRRVPSSLLNRLSSDYEGMDDGFNELLDVENFMESTGMPNGLNDLISGEIFSMSERPMELDASTTPEFPRTRPTGVRRSLSLQNERLKHDDECGTPPISKVRSCLFRSPNATSSASKLIYNDKPRSNIFSSPESPALSLKSFKRPDPPTDASPVLVKRCRKSSSLRELPESVEENKAPFHRYHSEPEAHAHIKSAIHRSTTDADLTGDFSKTCILPLAEGHHEDLKSISSDTLARLIHGEFKDSVASFQIVDCRYPYEFDAGHIEGALNLYTKDLIEEHLMSPIVNTPEIQPDTNKRTILVFHCEFSWERGPNLSRYLRNIDRKLNKEHYPALHYPEIYLLHGGYQQFYRAQKDLCTPQGYRSMTHPDHEADLRKFRSKSKSWQGEKSKNTGLLARSNLKRLGL